MSYRKHSQYTARSNYDRPCEGRNAKKHAEQLDPYENRYSRYADLEEVQPRRRRWAAGYIDRHSCPSNAYISTRARSPDAVCPSGTEYISQSKIREDDYIESREQRNPYTSRHSTNQPKTRYSEYHSPPSHVNLQDDHGRADKREPYYGSDIEDLDDHHKQAMTSKSYDSDVGEGSDIVIVNRMDGVSDVASIQSNRSSSSQSGRRSIRSLGSRSDVQDRKTRRSDSSSDSEGGYISLDDYIAGRSDCASNRSLSVDEGEGSDAVGSDIQEEIGVGEGSDVADGSDVAYLSDDGSYDDEDDCIDDGNYYPVRRMY